MRGSLVFGFPNAGGGVKEDPGTPPWVVTPDVTTRELWYNHWVVWQPGGYVKSATPLSELTTVS